MVPFGWHILTLPPYLQVPKHALLMALDHRPTPDLAAFCSVLATLEQGARVALQFRTAAERRRPSTVSMHIDWRWCAVDQQPRSPCEVVAHLLSKILCSELCSDGFGSQVDTRE